ncbi:hypothetical protein MAR_010243 [Mya arenaria]|uniref:Uncharacterized protein n=1 Tax=Mya arenaria TaxID=6604 RepID=A0ABY7E411_MYAAR|nr:hypothetical protein MAR_010243 [Mya arenaria]
MLSLAPCEANKATVCASPKSAALWRAVLPRSSCVLMSMPCASRSFIVATASDLSLPLTRISYGEGSAAMSVSPQRHQDMFTHSPLPTPDLRVQHHPGDQTPP